MANLSLRNIKIIIMAVMMVSAFAKTLNLIVEPKGKSIDTWSCKLFYKMGNIPKTYRLSHSLVLVVLLKQKFRKLLENLGDRSLPEQMAIKPFSSTLLF
jgi:hypothetical protein